MCYFRERTSVKKIKQFLSALVCGTICLNAANAAADNGISYGGGPVMVNPTHMGRPTPVLACSLIFNGSSNISFRWFGDLL